ncbi:MAG: hypothetical protein QXH24_00285 [Candidatus Bathyarchaeia archaeon]
MVKVFVSVGINLPAYFVAPLNLPSQSLALETIDISLKQLFCLNRI